MVLRREIERYISLEKESLGEGVESVGETVESFVSFHALRVGENSY